MRRLIRLAPLVALGLTLSFAGACRQPTTREGKTPEQRRESKRQAEVELPDPLPLPEQPRVASYIAQPGVAVAMLEPYSPVPLDLRAGAELALTNLTEPALAGEISRAIELSAPFANVVLDDGQEVIRISLRDDARASLAGRLGELEKVGEFGAVVVPQPPPPEGQPPRTRVRQWLAWIDEADGGSLVLANSLEGLVTGRTLAAAYGQQPVFFTVDPSSLPLPIDVPFSRISGRGDLSKLVIEGQAFDGQDPFAGLPITTGTLGGLLDAKQISAGVSSRYADYQATVRDVIVEVNGAVDELPFLIRGVAEGLAAKFITALRTWDGRVLAAMGPQNHVRLAYGAGDVEKSRVAVIRLLQAVVDNASALRTFSSQVPKISLRRKVGKGDGEDIELFVLHEANRLAPELRPLVDGEGKLNIAMAWSKRAGGGVIVIGPTATDELARWLDQTKDAANHAATDGQLLAASFAAEPEQLEPLLATPNPSLEQLVGLAATGPRWQVDVEDQGGGKFVVNVTTPGPPKPPRATNR